VGLMMRLCPPCWLYTVLLGLVNEWVKAFDRALFEVMYELKSHDRLRHQYRVRFIWLGVSWSVLHDHIQKKFEAFPSYRPVHVPYTSHVYCVLFSSEVSLSTTLSICCQEHHAGSFEIPTLRLLDENCTTNQHVERPYPHIVLPRQTRHCTRSDRSIGEA